LIGRSEWLLFSGEALISRNHELALVITAQAAPEYSATEADFKALAVSRSVPFLHSARINSPEALEVIEKAGPIDIGISINHPGILSQQVIDCFSHGVLNTHGGDLPRYRGNACQAWAILNGEPLVGLCVHRMAGGELDSGDILARARLPLQESTRVSEIHTWMTNQIPGLVVKAVEALEADRAFFIERQSDNPDDALRCYPRRPEDGRIDWTRPALEVVRLVNASSEPYGGAYCLLDGEPLVIWRAERLIDGELFCAMPGQVASFRRPDGALAVCTGAGKILIREVTYRSERMDHPGDLIHSLRARLT
jgi:UDP-4-amino-4-deoxy-L-arabinose formyltransferase/UDP-glucuronic acid dehydrogenase (UDP-4-keto-hexauronic acid decarboxylating)